MKSIMRVVMRRSEWMFSGPLEVMYWLLLILAGATTVICGALGWVQVEPTDADGWTQRTEPADGLLWLDAIHRGFRGLFSSDEFISGTIHGTPKLLIIARFSGAAFFVLAAGRLVLFAIGGRIAKLFARARNGHDIVVGKSATAQRYLQAVDRPINHLHVGVSQTEVTGRQRVASFQRSRDLQNDLRRAGIARARRIVVAEDDDEAVWSTARMISSMPEAQDKEIIANIEDPWLLERISRVDPESHIRPFSYASGAARQIMLAHPPYLLARAVGAPMQHIVIIGFGSMGQALLREFLVTSISWSPADMMVTIIDPDAERLAAQFRARHPGLAPYLRINFLAGDLTADDTKLEAAFAEQRRRSPVCAVYVSVAEELHPLRFAVGVKDRAERLGWFRAPIFVRAPDGAGLSILHQGVGTVGQGRNAAAAERHLIGELTLAPYGGWRAALDGAGLLSQGFDDQARVFHNAYRKLVGADAKPAEDAPPAQKPWAGLSEEYRVSNRRVAAHIRAKLDAAGYDLGDWLGAGNPEGRMHLSHEVPPASYVLDLDDVAELDRLASLEHMRWSVDRALNGWRYGKERDDEKRVHPLLVKERHLDEAEREKDRNNIRETAKLIRDIANGKFDKG